MIEKPKIRVLEFYSRYCEVMVLNGLKPREWSMLEPAEKMAIRHGLTDAVNKAVGYEPRCKRKGYSSRQFGLNAKALGINPKALGIAATQNGFAPVDMDLTPELGLRNAARLQRLAPTIKAMVAGGSK